MAGLAEGVQLVQHMPGLVQGHGRARAAVVAVAAMEVAGLGQVPLQGKGGYAGQFGVGEAPGTKARVADQGRGRGQQQPLADRRCHNGVDAADGYPGLGCRGPAVRPFHCHLHGQQIVSVRGADLCGSLRIGPVEQDQRGSPLRRKGWVVQACRQSGPVEFQDPHRWVDGQVRHGLRERGRGGV